MHQDEPRPHDNDKVDPEGRRSDADESVPTLQWEDIMIVERINRLPRERRELIRVMILT